MSLRELVNLLLRKWKTVVLITAAIMILATGYSVVKSVASLNSGDNEDQIYNVKIAVMIANYESDEENGKTNIDNNSFEMPDATEASTYAQTFNSYMHTEKILGEIAASVNNENGLPVEELTDNIKGAFTITSSGSVLFDIQVVYTGKEATVELTKVLVNTLTKAATDTFGFDYAKAVDSTDSLMSIAKEKGTGIGNIINSAVLYGIAGALLGIILAIFAVLMIDYFDISIRTEEKMQNECKLPVLGGDFLRVALTLSAICDNRKLREIVIVNADKFSAGEELNKYLNEQLKDKGIKITNVPGIFVEASSIKAAGQGDGVIIVAKQFDSTVKDVKKTLDVLKLTSTNVIGGVLILDK